MPNNTSPVLAKPESAESLDVRGTILIADDAASTYKTLKAILELALPEYSVAVETEAAAVRDTCQQLKPKILILDRSFHDNYFRYHAEQYDMEVFARNIRTRWPDLIQTAVVVYSNFDTEVDSHTFNEQYARYRIWSFPKDGGHEELLRFLITDVFPAIKQFDDLQGREGA